MAETRITNTLFYANNVSNVRLPAPSVTNVNVGVFDGVAYSNTSAPTLSRIGHVEDVFVQQGSTLVLTFESNIKSSLFRLYGYEDAVVTHSDDGKRITFSWQVPANIAGHSWYFGCRASTFGGSSSIFTRIHVGKTASDIFLCGVGTSRATISEGVNDTNLSSGCTLIVKKAVYKGSGNAIWIGSQSGRVDGMTFPNGQHVITTVNGEEIVDVSKYSSIMAEFPNEVVIDREFLSSDSLSLFGSDTINDNLTLSDVSGSTGGAQDGGRITRAISIVGFKFSNCYNTQVVRAKKIHIGGCSFVSPKYYGAPVSGRGHGDGIHFHFQGSEDCVFENFMAIVNDRATVAMYPATHKIKVRNYIITQGSSPMHIEGITQSFLGYGSIKTHFHNGLAIDAYEFRSGTTRTLNNSVDLNNVTATDVIDITESPENSSDGRYIDRDVAKATNGRNDQMEVLNVVSYNDYGTPFWWSKESGYVSNIPDSIENCVMWRARSAEAQFLTDTFSMLMGALLKIKNVTVGRNDALGDYTNASVFSGLAPNILGIAIINATWNTQLSNTDILVSIDEHSGRVANIGDVVVVNEPPNVASSFKDNATTYVAIANQNAVANGIKYITRVEPNSTYEGGTQFAQTVFKTRGRNFTFQNAQGAQTVDPDYYTIYDDNWVNTLPLESMCEHRREYSYTSPKDVTLTGDVGFARANNSRPDDYLNAVGTQPSQETVTPYILDIYARAVGGNIVVAFRPVAEEYRENIYGIDIYIDGSVHASDQPPEATEFTIQNLASGTYDVQLLYKNSVEGNSGLSSPISVTV